ncbi:MAG: LamB/YcsF family protein [Verrucomicrobia bacterium]|nr:LamB/YcsF family protein [Verrucomicrobiota bacterium]
MTVDLNCDLGEGAGQDEVLMPLLTSANIACGAHAGDEATMRATVALAQKHGVAIGAHPGFADRENFGRRELALPPDEVSELVAVQVRRLRGIAREAGGEVTHVKLHGALYNLASRDPVLAAGIVETVGRMEWRPTLFALAGSVLDRLARERGDLRVCSEVFADRTYERDGTLTPRARAGAVMADEEAALAQVLRMVRAGVVRATDGSDVAIRAETICVHGDNPRAAAFARRLRKELAAAGVALKASRA